MTPSISLEQLATKSKFTHKSQPKAYDSYMPENIASHRQPKAPVSPPESDSTASMENKDALLEYIAQQEQIRNDFNKKLAIEELNAISGTAFGDTLKGLAGIREKLKTAPRDQGKEIFPIDMLLIVLLLARITGCNTAQVISQYYSDNYFALQLFLPDLPSSPKHVLSATTISTLMRMFSEREIQELLTLYFAGSPAAASSETSRKTKDSHDSSAVAKSNAFIAMLPNLSVHGTVIMSATHDSSEEVSRAISLHGADFLLPIEQNARNKEFVGHVEAIFNSKQTKDDQDCLVRSYTEKEPDRTDSWVVELLPSSKLDPRINNPYKEVASLVRYTQKSESIVNGTTHSTETTHYYISSLEFSEENATQIMCSILGYWGIDSPLGRLATAKTFNQDDDQAILSKALGINKVAQNVLRSVRNIEAKRKAHKTPMSFTTTQTFLSSRSVAYQLLHLVKYIQRSDLG